jgi:4-azaleucine resistance transporter AzlC
MATLFCAAKNIDPAHRAACLRGLRDVAPMLPSVVPFGLAAGIAALEAGLGPAVGIGMSVIIFAGAAQLVVAQLLAEGAMPLVIIVSALIINLRMLIYSAGLAPAFGGLRLTGKASLAYLLTDQAYALSMLAFEETPSTAARVAYYLGVAFPLWLVWLLATVAGVWVGAAIPAGWQVGFALPLVFLAMLIPGLVNRPTVLAALVGGSVALLAHAAPWHLGLTIGATSGMAAGMLAERLTGRGRA